MAANVRRPIGVWVISGFYLLSVGWTLLSMALVLGGAIELNEAQRTYFESLTALDWGWSISIGLLGGAASVALLLLRRVAVRLFGIVFVLNIGQHLYQLLWRSYTSVARATPGAPAGMIIGLVILLVIVRYAWNLERKGILT